MGMTTKREATLAVQAAEARLGVTWAQLAEAVGAPLVWTTAALLGQHPMNVAQAQAAASMLELDQDVARALQAQPTRGALDAGVPVDPTIYRFYERAPGLRPTIKELIHEQRGDGIMSAINFRLDVRRVPDPVVIALWSPSMESSFPTSGESDALPDSCTMLCRFRRSAPVHTALRFRSPGHVVTPLADHITRAPSSSMVIMKTATVALARNRHGNRRSRHDERRS
jgi:cyanate lyase